MKLHLGCGENYLGGYRNIDFPSAEHTVQKKNVADEFHDIRTLRYRAGSIDEVRLHHVFEHFERFRACAFLAAWNSWLKPDGKVHIEVPDFETTYKRNLNALNRGRYEGLALRHIFGSQEAPWAVHFEGYSARRLKKLFTHFGFGKFEIERSDYKRTFNISIHAYKIKEMSREASRNAAAEYLRDYLVDDSNTEARMLEVWLLQYEQQIAQSFAG